jgi:hypothetical protein
MVALYFNDLLNREDIYNIANSLTNTIDDDDLINILVNGKADYNNKTLFVNYLNKLNINYLNPKETLVAIVFYYVLQDKIDICSGINFVNKNVRNYADTIYYLGDDVGIVSILSGYYFDIGDVIYEKHIKDIEFFLMDELRQYVYYNLPRLDFYDTKIILKNYIPKTIPYMSFLLHSERPYLSSDYKNTMRLENDIAHLFLPLLKENGIAFTLMEQNDKESVISIFKRDINKVFQLMYHAEKERHLKQ